MPALNTLFWAAGRGWGLQSAQHPLLLLLLLLPLLQLSQPPSVRTPEQGYIKMSDVVPRHVTSLQERHHFCCKVLKPWTVPYHGICDLVDRRSVGVDGFAWVDALMSAQRCYGTPSPVAKTAGPTPYRAGLFACACKRLFGGFFTTV
jgi:hypothetical protein